jgi:non-specific serine/threonine protein kinase
MVVLPFVNLTPGEGDYFADGLTDEIITDLSRVRALRVISRTSSIRLKGATESISDIAANLGVRYVLEGSVRQSGTSLRVMTTLIDVASDSAIWGQKYSGTTDDVFAIQERIARAIVDALRITLTPDEERGLADRPISDPRAYEWYLRARQELQRFTKHSLNRALEYLDKSTEIAGENVLLLAAQGETYWQYVNAGISSDRAYLDKAEECARRILAIDPASPHGHRVAGLARVHRGDAQGALRQLKQALDFDPNDPDSLYWGCLLAAFSGKHALAEAWGHRLLELDPVTPLYQTLPSRMAFMRGNYDRALALLAPHQAAIRDHAGLRITYGHLLAATGRIDDAQQVLEELAKDLPDHPFGQLAAVYGHALRGSRAQVIAGLTPALVEVLRSDPLYCWFIAQCHALVDDVDGAIHWIEVAVARGFINHDLLATRALGVARLHDDPRYLALIADADRQQQSLRI